MGEVPLARLWHLADGTSCLLLKDPRTENWELRVVRSDATLRSEHFSSPIVAMAEAAHWRVAFDSSPEASR
jgi:hypothetical protein